MCFVYSVHVVDSVIFLSFQCAVSVASCCLPKHVVRVSCCREFLYDCFNFVRLVFWHRVLHYTHSDFSEYSGLRLCVLYCFACCIRTLVYIDTSCFLQIKTKPKTESPLTTHWVFTRTEFTKMYSTFTCSSITNRQNSDECWLLDRILFIKTRPRLKLCKYLSRDRDWHVSRTSAQTCKFHPCFVHLSENSKFTVNLRAGVNRALMCFRVVITLILLRVQSISHFTQFCHNFTTIFVAIVLRAVSGVSSFRIQVFELSDFFCGACYFGVIYKSFIRQKLVAHKKHRKQT